MEYGCTDLLLINPGGQYKVYQKLADNLTAVEPPLWCRLIAGYIRDRNFTVKIIDCEAESLEASMLVQKVGAISPKLIAMVIYGHQPSASTQQMASAGEKCRAIKEQFEKIPIIMIGGHVSSLPERTLKEETVDFVCKGEGPLTIAQLLEAIKNPLACNLEEVQGLVWEKEGEFISNTPAPLIKDLDNELHGNVWDLLPMDKYRAHNWQCFGDLDSRQFYASIYTSLGCPYKCVFCCINAPFETNGYRMRSPKAVVDEIALLHDSYGVKTLKIVDEMFVLNDRHVNEICDLLIARNYDLNIWAYARVDTVKSEILFKLKNAGIRWLALGIESGSAHVRDGAEKAFSQQEIKDIVHKIQLAGIQVIGNFIFGLPDDDFSTMRETLDLAKELNCEFVNFYSAMAYPGSPLYDLALEEGLALPDQWSGFSQHSFDCNPLSTNYLSSSEVLEFRDKAFVEYFSNSRYLGMIAQKFGKETRLHIEGMVQHRLKRKILEELDDVK
ncbi:MAG: radical SAM protein [Pseudomonadota bacterium]|nr:radical SAM protein [Pseudomonadota bacterium]